MSNKMPNLSSVDTDWNMDDFNSIINKPTITTPVINTREESTNDNVSTANNAPVVHQKDEYLEQMNSVLDATKSIDEVNIEQNQNAYNHDNFRGVDTPNVGSGQQNNNQEDSYDDNDLYVAAFDIIKELDLIRLPEDVDYSKLDAATLVALKEETLEMQRQEAYDYMRQEVGHDPYVLELLDYSYQGGKFVDVPKMVGILQRDVDYRTLDLSKETTQKELLKRYLSNGLNPNIDRDKKLLEFIPNQINEMIKNKVLRQEAEKARSFFLEQSNIEKQKEYQRVIQQKEAEKQEQIRYNKEMDLWDQNFKASLAARKWSEERKDAVKKEASFVKLQDGREVQVWQLKQDMIFNDPALFQMFLDFTSKFDLKEKAFKEQEQEEELSSSAVNKLVERLQRKNTSTNANIANDVNRSKKNENKTAGIDVNRNWF